MRLLLLAAAFAAPSLGVASPENLLGRLSDWKVVTPFETAAMVIDSVPASGPGEAPLRLRIASRGSARDVGGWVRALPPFQRGRRYRLEASFAVEGIAAPQRRVFALLTHGGRELQEFRAVAREGNRSRIALEFTPEKDLARPELRFYLADTAHGAVVFETASLVDITDTYRPRTARIGAISGKPDRPPSAAAAVAYYLEKLDQISGLGLDLVCLPENINTDQVAVDDKWPLLETIPGPTTDALARKAREHKVYIAASIAERDGDIRYNTAVLIDRSGRIVAKYRKTHLTVTEQLIAGITPGNDFVVHPTEFGNVGLMICYDHHFAEVPRALALLGADILVLPNAADGREGGTLWEAAMRMRAVENHVHIVSAVNYGRSLVAAPDGALLAINGKFERDPGGLVHAVCQLDDSVADHTRQPIGKRYLELRRPEIYSALLRDTHGDAKAPAPSDPGRK